MNSTISKYGVLCAIAILVAGCDNTSLPPSSASWRTESTTGYTARYAAGSAVVSGKIYVFGGATSASPQSTILEVYDPSADSWSTPQTTGTFTARSHPEAVALNGSVYVIGGNQWTGQTTVGLSTLEVFDPSANSWSTPTTTGTFTPRSEFTACAVNGKIYAIAGDVGASHYGFITTTQVLDPSTNTWSTLTTSGNYTPRFGATANVVNGKIYLIGGETNALTYDSTVEEFDPSSNTWSTPSVTGTFMPRVFAGSTVLGGKIYVFGGEGLVGGKAGALNTVQVFDPATNAWSMASASGTFHPRYGAIAEAVNGASYVIGGEDTTAIVNANEAFAPGN